MRIIVAALALQAAVLSPLAAQRQQTIIATAQSAGQFNTLLAAVDAAELTATLKSAGPFTVFAPTDAAFAKLPSGTVESLLKPENKQKLKEILLYHVVAGKVSAATARTLDQANTVEGRAVQIRADGNKLRINSATVITADIAASNGVIHVIDEVLLPPAAASSNTRGRMTRGDNSAARAVLELAIQRGVPLYNDGNTAATSAIYEVAAQSVLTLGSSVPTDARRALERGLREAMQDDDDSDRAWTLRRALDDANRSLGGGRSTMSTRH